MNKKLSGCTLSKERTTGTATMWADTGTARHVRWLMRRRPRTWVAVLGGRKRRHDPCVHAHSLISRARPPTNDGSAATAQRTNLSSDF
eukprot:7132673-Prymnesium_polylepis.1